MVGSVVDFRIVVLAAVLLVFAMVLAYRLIRRDVDVQRTRWGFFVERHRYEDEKKDDEPVEPWPNRREDDDTLIQ